MSTILTPFMRRAIALFESNDIHAEPVFSGLRDLRLDSPELGRSRGATSRVGSTGLPFEIIDAGRQAYAVLRREAPTGMGLKQAASYLLKTNASLAEGDRLLRNRGYVREIGALMPRLFEEDMQAYEPGEERWRTVEFKYRKKGLGAEEVLAEAQWTLAHARKLWPEANWRK
jgi:hypothetical protein